MANKPWYGTPWEKIWVKDYEAREVFQGGIHSFDQVRDILEEADALKAELGEGWKISEGIDAYGDEGDSYTEGYFTFVKPFSDEEIDALKKASWEKQERDRAERVRQEEEKDFKQYQELKKKFENLGENLL